MLSNTSRWIADSSWNWNTVAATPERATTRAIPTPMTMAIWFGLNRVGPGSGSVVSSA